MLKCRTNHLTGSIRKRVSSCGDRRTQRYSGPALCPLTSIQPPVLALHTTVIDCSFDNTLLWQSKTSACYMSEKIMCVSNAKGYNSIERAGHAQVFRSDVCWMRTVKHHLSGALDAIHHHGGTLRCDLCRHQDSDEDDLAKVDPGNVRVAAMESLWPIRGLGVEKDDEE